MLKERGHLPKLYNLIAKKSYLKEENILKLFLAIIYF